MMSLDVACVTHGPMKLDAFSHFPSDALTGAT